MILALDLGSTSFKAAVYDHDLQLLGSGASAVEHIYGGNNQVELPVATALAAFRQAIEAALQAARIGPEALTALAIDSQAQTFTVVDAAGEPRLPFISWQDNRAGQACEALKATGTLDDVEAHCSFGALLAPLQLCQLRHIRGQHPALIQPTDQILHLPTFLVRAISQESVIDDNLAAMSGTYSLAKRDWWPAALAAVGLTRAHFPRVVPVGTVATRTTPAAGAFGLPSDLPIVLAGNDQTAGGYGARLEELGAVLITLGTAQVGYAAGTVAAEPGPSLVRGPYPGGLHYTLVCDDVGGNVINWAEGVLQGAETPAAFFALAAQAPPGCRGLTFSANLQTGSGSWHGLSFSHGPAEMARAIIETLSLRMKALIETMPVQNPACLVAGGGSRSALWVEILSEAMGSKLQRVEADPLLGAARMAQVALA